MGAAEDLRAMVDRHELELVDHDLAKAEVLLNAAGRALETARSIAAKDPDSAMTVAWDRVAFQALAAMLAIAGYRVTSQQGHHRVAVDAGRLLLPDEKLLSRIGTLRRTRDRGMYESEPATKAEVDQAIRDCQELVQLVRAARERARALG
jgi:hypothetical protein